MKLTLLFAILLISSCTIQKRVFRSGYHIEWNKNYSASKSNEFSESIVVSKKHNEQIDEQGVSNGVKDNEMIISSDFVNNETDDVSELNLKSDEAIALNMKENNSVRQINNVISQQDIELGKISISNSSSKHVKKASTAAANGGKLQIVALILCILLGLIGVHRFYLGYTGLGILYLFTLGLFGIGWIIDIILLIIPNGLTPKGKNNYKE